MEFENASGDRDDAWLATAIPEMLRAELAAGGKLRLIPSEDVARMRQEVRLASIGSLAREEAVRVGNNLTVDLLVTGSYTTLGSDPDRRVRLDIGLQDARSGGALGEFAELGSEQHLFELVSRAGARLRDHLGVPGMSAAEEAAVRASLPSNTDAAQLYAQGLSRLRVLDAVAARNFLEQAISAEPKFPLSHMALASAWRLLGYDQRAQAEAKKAFDLSSALPRADQLRIEGRYYEMSGEMGKAIEAYRALFTSSPDSLEDGLLLAEAETWGGKLADALLTVDALHRLPEPLSQDPRIDIQQARATGVQGDNQGALLLIRRAEEEIKRQVAPLLLARAQIIECSQLITLGHFEDAANACEASHRVFAETGNPSEAAHAVRFLGDVRLRQGRLAEALDLFRQALRFNQVASDDRGTAVSLNEIAIVYEDQGDLKQAEKLYRQSYSLFLKVGHRKNAGVLAFNVGGILLSEGKLAEAERLFQKSLSLAREAGSEDAEGYVMGGLALLHLTRGNLEAAHQYAKGSVAQKRKSGDAHGLSSAVSVLGEVLATQGDLVGARQNQSEALSVAQNIGAKGLVAESRLALARLDLEEGQPAQGEKFLRDAITVFRSERMHDDELQAQIVLSRCLMAQEKVGEARAALNEVRGAVARSQNPATRLRFAIADALVASADPSVSSPMRRQAEAELQRSMIAARNLGFIPLQYEARLALAEIELKRHPVAGRENLVALEREAHERGLGLIALKAAKLGGRHS